MTSELYSSFSFELCQNVLFYVNGEMWGMS